MTKIRTGTDAETARQRWRGLVEADPDRPSLHCGGRVWSRAQVDDEVRRRAAGLESLGVGQGTRVLVGVDTSAEGFFAHMVVRELGAVMIALVPSLTFSELAYQIDHCQGEVLVMEGAVEATIAGRSGEFDSVCQIVSRKGPGPGESGLTLDEIAAFDPLPVRDLPGHDSMSPSVILYTSGSTSKPKGVVLPDGSLVSSGQGYADRYGIREDDNFLLPFTLAHGVGGLVIPGVGLASGCEVTLERKFSPSVFWERARDTAATVTLLFPAQLQLLLKLSNDGAETVDNDLRMVITHVYDADFAERFDLEIGTVWGCTESGACGAGSEIGYRGERGEGYVGLPLGTEDLRIHDAAGDELPTGETGEVWLRHQHVMIEYLADPVETDKVLIDGWVRTGDYGALDEEGRLFYRGRLKNMVKRSGENISPEEVEATLLEHPDIVECVVFGVPDPLRTEELSAHIVVTESFAGDPASLSIFVGESLARWKAPRYVRLYQEPFPRLASGKIDQVSVKEDFSPELSWDGEAGGLTSGRA